MGPPTLPVVKLILEYHPNQGKVSEHEKGNIRSLCNSTEGLDPLFRNSYRILLGVAQSERTACIIGHVGT